MEVATETPFVLLLILVICIGNGRRDENSKVWTRIAVVTNSSFFCARSDVNCDCMHVIGVSGTVSQRYTKKGEENGRREKFIF